MQPIRLQGDMVSRPGERNQPDIQVPVVVKLLSGAAISRNVSYYAYFLLAERGQTGGLEDTWLLIKDVPTSRLELKEIMISCRITPGIPFKSTVLLRFLT